MKGLVRELKSHREPVERLAWAPAGDVLASGSRDGTVPLDCLVRPLTLRHGDSFISGMVWSPDGRLLATAEEAGVVRLWDRDGKQAVPMFQAAQRSWISAHCWSHDGALRATGGDDGWIRVWSRDGNCVARARCLWGVDALVFAPDDATLRAADDGTTSGNRPIPYVFELAGFPHLISGRGLLHADRGTDPG